MKQLGLAYVQYEQDYNYVYPSGVSAAGNRSLARRQLEMLPNPAATVMLYEFTTLNCNPSTSETISATGTTAPQDSTRHDPKTFGLNFLMADGSVKWLFPAQVSNEPGAVSPKRLLSSKRVRTFAVK